LSTAGYLINYFSSIYSSDFAVMGMHFKLGLYEH
jgi:hypothetical protein